MGKAIIGVCAVILVAMVVAVAVGITHSRSGSGGELEASKKAVKTICQPTDYQEACENSLAGSNTTDPKELIKAGLQAAIVEIKKVVSNSGTIQDAAKDPMSRQALDNCKELMGYSIDDLTKSFNQLGAFNASTLDEYVENLKIWTGGSITYQQTCLDGFVNVSTEAGEKMRKLLNTSQKLTSNGLAMVSEIPKLIRDLNFPGLTRAEGSTRKLLAKDGFPSWVSFKQRMLLQQKASQMKPNVVVAKDGSGKYTSINQALKEVPNKNASPFVIYIKAGVYTEKVTVDKYKSNVVFIGDGPTKTTITGRLNFVDGTSTFNTATVAVMGPKFLAKNIGFQNTAGAIKHQAVALKIQSDQTIFHNRQMDGYQDTLYAHSQRQFFRDCTISGTIDFIFGDSTAVFQNCKLIIRKPLDKQQCIVTAQGRSNRRLATGFVLQNCIISGAQDYLPVKASSKTYLGRPWHEYSRTLFMQSQLDDIIAPEGWMPWNGNFALDTHSQRQFFRDCTISGTIDFIFGDSTAVFQNCKLIIRKPLDKQQCIVTAQGRSNRRLATGFVLQNCIISGAQDYLPVKASIKTYLGRPWHEYSRTLFMQSQLDDIIAPEGWMPWNGNFALDTLWYAEFNNRGPGAVQTNRVKWRGIQKITAAQAQQFTAGAFLLGGQWIPSSGVPYTAGL